MKRFNVLIVFMLLTVSLLAQDLIPTFIGHVNRCATVNLKDFRHHLCREYRISSRDLDMYYRSCGNNWGNVGIALELSRSSGRSIRDVCNAYRNYGRRGWDRVIYNLNIRPGSNHYDVFYYNINVHNKGWIDFYNRHDCHHDGYYVKKKTP